MAEHLSSPGSLVPVIEDRLLLIMERLDRRQAQSKAPPSAVLAMAERAGFDIGAVRRVMALRKQQMTGGEASEPLAELYRRALGM